MAKAVVMDISITHPCAASFLTDAAAAEGAAARQREQKKMAKYGQAADAAGFRMVPAVFETFGTAGPLFKAYFKEVTKPKQNRRSLGDEEGGESWAANTFAAFWQQRISVALQRGNSDVIVQRAIRDAESHSE